MMYFFFFEGLGRVRVFMVLHNYFTYFELSQSLGWAKSKDHYGKKNTRSPAPSIYIQAIFPGFPASDFALGF